ncbi:Nephrin [Trichinella pseudospiralis]|uniref:Nephrin n=1 Tax=Trichinella pseudospiralis TaxID=6337 RepID=A0A0V1EYA1_TRIPS|nr:Nephrin [Trichinella pseudospiralis]
MAFFHSTGSMSSTSAGSFPKANLVRYCGQYGMASLVSTQKQYFKVPPNNVTVIEGQTAVLQCIISNQQGHTQWTKGGTFLGIDYNLYGYDRYRIVGSRSSGEYNLEISQAKLEDDGEFECQVSPGSEDGKGLRAVGSLNVLIPPKIVTLDPEKDGGKVESRSGRTVEVNCRAVGSKPKSEIRWYKNDKLIQDSNTFEESVQEKDKLITTVSRIRWVAQPEDDGAIFTCSARHPALLAEDALKTNFTLSVLYPPSFPEIRGYDGRTLKAGEKLRLECEVTNGNPPPEVFWYRNDKIIDRTYVTHSTSSTNDYDFIVDGSDHEAVYACHASNPAVVTPLTSNVRLNVFYPPRKVHVSGPELSKIGDTVSFSCISGSSNPPAKIYWVIDGKPIKESVSSIRPSSDGKGFFSVSNISVQITNEKRDIQIVCSAVNEEILPSEGGHPPESVSIFGYDGTPVVAGNIQRLSCVAVGGNPLPTINWFKGKRRVTTGILNTVSDNAAQSELAFPVAASDNLAAYKCSAQNEASTKLLTASVNLTVLFPPSSLSIHVKPDILKVGNIAQLTCETSSGNPAPIITWWRAGENVAGVDVHNKSGFNGGWVVKSKLYVPLTAEEDGMKYTCRATTAEIGQNSPIFFLRDPQEITVLENETVILNATASANPEPIIYEWLKDGKPMRNSFYKSNKPKVVLSGSVLTINEIDRAHNSAEITHITESVMKRVGDDVQLECEATAYPIVNNMISWERDGFNMSRVSIRHTSEMSMLRISDINIEDAGAFTCTAYNGIGTRAKKKAWIIVKHAPTVYKNLTYSKVASEVGAEVVLQCLCRGAPQVAWQWKRDDGKELDYDVRFNTKLVIKRVLQNDYGKYICIARNELGTDQFEIPLRHLSKPDLPTNLTISNISHDAVSLQWRENFDGGLNQLFRIRYFSWHAPERPLFSPTINETTITITGLSPSTKYSFAVEALNKLGSRGFSKNTVSAETLRISGIANQLGIKEDIPILVIVLVCLVGVVLLALNVFLVLCFIRRHRNRKLQEKAANVRLLEQAQPEAAPYAVVEKLLNGSVNNQESSVQFESNSNNRASQFSEDNMSMRTEVDSAGRPIFNKPCSALEQPSYFNYQSNLDYDNAPSDALYAESLRTNTLQRQLMSPLYEDSTAFHAASDEEFTLPMMGPLRSVSQELSNYSGFANSPTIRSSSLRRSVFDRGSPNVSSQASTVGTVVYNNGRSPFAEVRPMPSPQRNGYKVGNSGTLNGSPGVNTSLLSTFPNNLNSRDYMAFDGGLTGDIV